MKKYLKIVLLVIVAITMLIHFGHKNMAITIPGLIIICREIFKPEFCTRCEFHRLR